MFFNNGDHRAFESLMRDKPGDNYDSGADGPFTDVRAKAVTSAVHNARLSLRTANRLE